MHARRIEDALHDVDAVRTCVAVGIGDPSRPTLPPRLMGMTGPILPIVDPHEKEFPAAAISLGTYSGGWRIMRTLGRRIIHLDPARGFAS